MTVRAAWLLPTGQTREDTRVTPVGTVTPTGELTSRGGVLPGGAPFLAAPAGAMTVQIGIGRAVVQGTAAQGPYPVAVDAPELVAIGAGDALDRIDTVIVRVYDGMYDTEGQTVATVELVQGEPMGAPTPPALPPASLPLWDVRVRAGASASTGGVDWASALTDRRRYTVGVGGIIPRGATGDVGAFDGQYRDMNGVLERWDATGAAWRTYRPPTLAAESITSGFLTGTGWSMNTFNARRRAGVVTFSAYLTRTGGNLSDPTNLPDTFVGSLPNGWAPLFAYEAIATDGYGHGTARIEADAQIYLRTWSPGIVLAKDHNMRISATYVQ
ncbi:hypothetical protein [Streptomyces iconiensis]|uniref:Minor tail protein n=1 Tax=Streptomyces iconiensis TaxID=1384038 RepID=A0ABT7A4G5_9ACTN|nr:hypothetical protein [Streptomyces iconiensis]MDJ1136210.1 hypothetical protein [Streptomyces iconiensis]